MASSKSSNATKRAQSKPGPVTVIAPPKPVVSAEPPSTAPAPAPALASSSTPSPSVALRGGLAIQSVKLTGKPYQVGAPHNARWWQACQAQVTAGNGQTTVAALLTASVPAPFIGYMVRRGYMAAV